MAYKEQVVTVQIEYKEIWDQDAEEKAVIRELSGKKGNGDE